MASPSARPWPATPPRFGVPARVPLLAVAVLSLPFLMPGDLSVPEGAVAVVGAVILGYAGFDHPRFSPARGHWLTGALAFAAFVLVAGQMFLDRAPTAPFVELPGVAAAPERPRGASRPAKRAHAARPRRAPAAASSKRADAAAPAKRTRPASAPSASAPAATAPAATAPSASAPAAPAPAAPSPSLREGTPVPAAAPAGAERFARDYYAALDERRFAVAWRMLAPGVQAAFGGQAAWRKGYARTVSSAPQSLRVTAAGGGATVGLMLRAGDRGACGKTVVRRFAVTWRLARTEAGWRATAATGRKLGGPEPAAVC